MERKNWLKMVLIVGFTAISFLGLARTAMAKTVLIDDFEGGEGTWWALHAEIKLVSPGCPESKRYAAFASFSTPRGVGVIRRNHDFKEWIGCDHISFWLKGDGSQRKAYFYLFDNNGPQYHPFMLDETAWHKVTLYFKNFISERNGRCIGGVEVDRLGAQIDIYADNGASFTFDHLQVCSSDTLEGKSMEYKKYSKLILEGIETPIIKIPKIIAPPTIDGELEESIWKEASEISRFFNLFGEKASFQTKVFIAYDNSNIYFFFLCNEPYMNYVKACEKSRDGLVWEDDCVEIFLQPYFDKEYEKKYYHLITNTIATKYDEIGFGGIGWNPKWEVKTSLSTSSWMAEITVPFGSLVSNSPKTGDVWRFNLCRTEWVKGECSSWSWTKGGFHKPERFGYLIFGDETSPSFSQLDLGEEFSLGDNFAKFTLRNHNPSQEIALKINIEDVLGEYSLYEDTFTIEPNKEETVSVKYRIRERGRHNLRMRVTESSGEVVYQSPAYSFTIPPLLVTSLDRSDGYYYEDDKKLQLKIKLNPENKADLKRMQLGVFLEEKGKTIEEKKLESLSSEEIDSSFDLSLLPLGKYTIRTILLNKKGKELASFSEDFQKTKMPFVRVDEEGRILIEGKPFFPLIAWYRPINYVKHPQDLTKVVVEKTLSEVKEAGFNAIEGIAVGYYIPHPEHYKILLDIAHQKGLKVMAELWGNLLETFKEDKNIFAWYISDEPEFSGVPRENIIKTHNMVKEKDPYHRPTVMSNVLVNGIKKYAGITDIHSTHPYPIPSQPLDILYTQEKMVVELAKGKKISPWATIQLHDLSKYGFKGRAPTPEEVKCLVYLAITAGAKGLMYYTYSDYNWDADTHWSIPEDYPEINEGLKKIHAEIEELAPIILSKDAEETIILKPNNLSIHFLLKEYNKKLYLIAVNSAPKAVTVTFCFPELKMVNIEDFFTRKLIRFESKSFTDTFQTYQAKVYRIE